MLRQGPIPAFIHGVVEYLVAAVFIAAPFVLKFDSGTPKAVSIVVWIVILVITASSDLPTGLAKVVQVPIHVTLDFIVGIVLVAAPFLFRFTADSKATAFFVVLGIAHILITIGTRFLPPRAPASPAQG